MKTVYAPDAPAAWLDAARDLALSYPVAAFAALVIMTALFAARAARGL